MRFGIPGCLGGFSAQGLPLDVTFPETTTTPMVDAFVSSSSEPSMGLIADRVKRLMSKFKPKGQEKSVLKKKERGSFPEGGPKALR